MEAKLPLVSEHSLPPLQLPELPVAPVAAPPSVEVPVVPMDPLDNTPLLRLLEDLSRFGSDLGADAEHFSAGDRELSEFVLERMMEMMERVPGVTRIAPSPGDAVVRGEHKCVDGIVSAGTVKRLVLPGVRVSERIVRPALVEIES